MTYADKAITHLDPQEAWTMMQGDPSVLLVDVRSDMEFLMIGHAKGAVHIAWIDAPDWTVNPTFVPQVRKLMLGRLSGNARGTIPIILICRSGNRSLDAARELCKTELDDIHVVTGGFEGPLDDEHHRNTIAGWRYAGLPWEQC